MATLSTAIAVNVNGVKFSGEYGNYLKDIIYYSVLTIHIMQHYLLNDKQSLS